ncbi:MAG: AAA family ATPase [Armatimonadetes bacterium]|nr:AAA family ATPase [Armatimonadota bacterium]
MTHITEFTVTGLAGRTEPYTQKLNRDVNIFFGFNGCGKTSLLKILHSAMSDDASILANVPFESAEVKIYSVTYDTVLTRTIVKTETSREQKGITGLENQLGLWTEATIEVQTSSTMKWKTTSRTKKIRGIWAHRYLPTSRLYLESVRYTLSQRARILSEDQLDAIFAESVQRLWVRYSNDILSTVRNAQEEGLRNILQAILSPSEGSPIKTNVDPKKAYQQVSSFLSRQGSSDIIRSQEGFIALYNDNNNLKSVVNDISSVEQKIETAMAPREQLQSTIQQLFSGNKSIKFTDGAIQATATDGTDIGLGTLSSGEKQLLHILIETLLAEGNSAIIDEPELSMHIDWQKQLVNVMRTLNPRAQLILATHSPEIMADVEDDKIFRI